MKPTGGLLVARSTLASNFEVYRRPNWSAAAEWSEAHCSRLLVRAAPSGGGSLAATSGRASRLPLHGRPSSMGACAGQREGAPRSPPANCIGRLEPGGQPSAGAVCVAPAARPAAAPPPPLSSAQLGRPPLPLAKGGAAMSSPVGRSDERKQQHRQHQQARQTHPEQDWPRKLGDQCERKWRAPRSGGAVAVAER